MLDQAAGPHASLYAPSALYLDGNDHLRLTSRNTAASVVLTIGYRVLLREGRVVQGAFTHTPNTDATAASTNHLLPEGWLLSVTVLASSGSPARAQCFARVDLVRGVSATAIASATLLQGFVSDVVALAWPGSSIQASVEGQGRLRIITGTNPAAGAEVSETVPTGRRWRLTAVKTALATDATATNRLVSLLIDDGSTEVIRCYNNQNCSAGATWFAYFSVDAQRDGGGTTAQVGHSRIPLLDLAAGWRILTATLNLQAGDDFAAPILHVQEWLEG